MTAGPKKQTTRRSFIRWVGGKYYVVPKIKDTLTLPTTRYYEPFLGGGNLYLNIMDQVEHAYLSDINPDIINLWKVLQTNVDDFYEVLSALPLHKTKENLTQLKQRWSAARSNIEKSALFLRISKMALLGRVTRNKNGTLHATIDWYAIKDTIVGRQDRFYATLTPYEEFKEISLHLSRAIIQQHGYREVNISPGSTVFLDPPYLSNTTGVQYDHSDQFKERDQADLCKRASIWARPQHNIQVRYCNYNIGFIARNMTGFKTLHLNDESKRKGHWHKKEIETLWFN